MDNVPEETLTRDEAQQVVRRLVRMLRRYRRRITVAVVLLVLQVAALLAGPALVRHGIDAGLRKHDAGALNLSAAIYLVVAFVGLFLGRAVILLVARVGESFLRDLRNRLQTWDEAEY
jgi:ATP-binding cassette subfamily B protein